MTGQMSGCIICIYEMARAFALILSIDEIDTATNFSKRLPELYLNARTIHRNIS